VTITTVPLPSGISITAVPETIEVGGNSDITVHFTDGTGVLRKYPGGRSWTVTDGETVNTGALNDTQAYALTVRNAADDGPQMPSIVTVVVGDKSQILNFWAEPSLVISGQKAILRAAYFSNNGSDATVVELGGIPLKDVFSGGQVETDAIVGDTTYTLRINGKDGEIVESQVVVRAPIVSFEASPNPVDRGFTTTLTAVFTYGDGWIEGLGPVESGVPIESFKLWNTQNFYLNIWSDGMNGGYVTQELQVDVLESPNDVQNLQGTSEDGAVTLNWMDPMEPPAFTDIEISFMKDGVPVLEKAAKGDGNININGLTNGTMYSFTVKAVDSGTGRKSTGVTVDVTPHVPLPEVQNAGTVSADHRVNLQWNDPNSTQIVSIRVSCMYFDMMGQHQCATFLKEVPCSGLDGGFGCLGGSNGTFFDSLVAGKPHQFVIGTVDGSGFESVGVTLNAQPGPMLPEVNNLMLNASNQRVDLNWNDPNSTEVVKIHVTCNYQDVTGMQPCATSFKELDCTGGSCTGAPNAVFFDSLINGKMHVFTVKTANAAGDESSGDMRNIMPGNYLPDVENLYFMAADQSATLMWEDPNAPVTVTGIRVACDAVNTGSGWLKCTIPERNLPCAGGSCTGAANQTAYSGLVNDGQYQFNVRTTGPDGESAGRQINVIPGVPLPEVTNLGATPGDSRADLHWNDPNDSSIIKIRIFCFIKNGGIEPSPCSESFRELNCAGGTCNGTLNSAAYLGLTNDQPYIFTLRTFNGSKESNGSVIETTPVKPPMAKVVISQVYGGGGSAAGVYKYDFIELFNAGNAPANLAGWSVQYASETGVFGSSKTDLTGFTLQPGARYLIQQGFAGTGGAELPTPDATGSSFSMGLSAGKVALVNSTTMLPSETCPTGQPTVVDFIGYGSSTNCSYVLPVSDLSATTAAIRNSNGCFDTKNNSNDFAVMAPNPRNSASPYSVCP
jgi:hypothetical protein